MIPVDCIDEDMDLTDCDPRPHLPVMATLVLVDSCFGSTSTA